MNILDELDAGKFIDIVTGCWIWKAGKTSAGYGMLYIDGVGHYVHRLSAQFYHGLDISDSEKFVCHICDNPSCYNPEHLFISDAQGNSRDASKKGRSRNQNKGKLVCKHGHEFTPENTYIYQTYDGRIHRECFICKRKRSQEREDELKEERRQLKLT